MSAPEFIRIGSGAAFSGDRIEPAVELVEKGDIHFLAFECLAERTIALAQGVKRQDPNHGYDPLLEARMKAVLPGCVKNGVRIISNMGAANPIAAGHKIRQIADALGYHHLKIATVTGDDIFSRFTLGELKLPSAVKSEHLLSANAYIGSQPIVEALRQGADIVITGRVSDPSLFLAPMIAEFNWDMNDWHRLGQGTVIGHLLECAGQITGGYFADPGLKEVPSLVRLGFPLAEVYPDGSATITKVPESGGRVTLATCKEQLLYEIHNPEAYLTPDVIADFSEVIFEEIALDRIAVRGGKGRPYPPTLKASLGYHDGFIGEGQISYAGPGAAERGMLALDIVKDRLLLQAQYRDLRTELIGVNSVFSGRDLRKHAPAEVRARIAARTWTANDAQQIGAEVEALYTNGPAGGGGVTKQVKEIIAVASTLVERQYVEPSIAFIGGSHETV